MTKARIDVQLVLDAEKDVTQTEVEAAFQRVCETHGWQMVEGAVEVTALHRYLYLNRPPGIGCQPDGFVDREWFGSHQPTETCDGETYAHGRVFYAERLDFDEAWRFDLLPEDPVELALLRLHRRSMSVRTLQSYWTAPDLEDWEETAVVVCIRTLKAALSLDTVIRALETGRLD